LEVSTGRGGWRGGELELAFPWSVATTGGFEVVSLLTTDSGCA